MAYPTSKGCSYRNVREEVILLGVRYAWLDVLTSGVYIHYGIIIIFLHLVLVRDPVLSWV